MIQNIGVILILLYMLNIILLAIIFVTEPMETNVSTDIHKKSCYTLSVILFVLGISLYFQVPELDLLWFPPIIFAFGTRKM